MWQLPQSEIPPRRKTPEPKAMALANLLLEISSPSAIMAASQGTPPPNNASPPLFYSAPVLSPEPADILIEEREGYRLEREGDFLKEVLEILEEAKHCLKRFNPLLIGEIDFFVKKFVFSLSTEGKYTSSSSPWQPGIVELAPYLLAKKEGKACKRGDPLLGMLTAALLLHESRHQKHYFIFRSAGTEFVRPEFAEIPMTVTWTNPPSQKPLHKFFTYAIAVGMEMLFLGHLLERPGMPAQDREVLEKIRRRKLKYLFPLLVQGELYRQMFTKEGQILLEKLFERFGYQKEAQ